MHACSKLYSEKEMCFEGAIQAVRFFPAALRVICCDVRLNRMASQPQLISVISQSHLQLENTKVLAFMLALPSQAMQMAKV